MKVFSIFKSINGEVNKFHQGSVATFIRFAGCNLWEKKLCCTYCDTKRAQNPYEGKEMSVGAIVRAVKKLKCYNITITGGEPLHQDPYDLCHLIYELGMHGSDISIETNGTEDIPYELAKDTVSWVVDWKLPSSGVNHLMKLNRFDLLGFYDPIIKFVISDETDYLEAKRVMKKLGKNIMNPTFAFSPVEGFSGKTLTEWVIKDNLDVVINLQLHKILNLVEDKSSGL